MGGGLGVYEPVPDRTVSGNTGKFVGQWGVSADKKRQECGESSPIPTVCFANVTAAASYLTLFIQVLLVAFRVRMRDSLAEVMFCKGTIDD
ncbi:hypothetical protein Amn_52790 [Aminobacter sp. Y103A]|nr:hypothetical protein Amn_52790 [Aminobacter sp. SS-2016]